MEPISCDKLFRCAKTQTITLMVIFACTGPTIGVMTGFQASPLAGLAAGFIAVAFMALIVYALIRAAAATPRLTFDSESKELVRETGWLFIQPKCELIDLSSIKSLGLDAITGLECRNADSPTTDKHLYVLTCVRQNGVKEVLVRSNYASDIEGVTNRVASALGIVAERSEKYSHIAKLNAFREK